MPGAHRNTDARKCGGQTTVVGQSTVFVNDELWAVDGDTCTHGAGPLKAVTGGQNVYVEDKLVIVATGDTVSGPDNANHQVGQADPQQASSDVFAYD